MTRPPRFIAFDAHCDSILDVVAGRRSLGLRSTEGHIDLPRLRLGNVGVQFFSCFVEQAYKPDRSLVRVLQIIETFHSELDANPGLVLIRSKSDLDRIGDDGPVGAVLSLEGAEPIGTELVLLRLLFRLGVRSIGLVWNHRNMIGDGVGDARANGGLTSFGVEVVKEMNRLGMVVDVSHLNERGFWDVLSITDSPIIASHSNARSLCDHPRNLTDDQIKKLAENGGVIGVNFYPLFLSTEGKASIENVIQHIEHICEVGGVESVGLGSDFDGIDKVPEGLEDVTCVPRIAEALLNRGFSDREVGLIMGGNMKRLLRAVLPPG